MDFRKILESVETLSSNNPEAPPCRGVFYRCRVNVFATPAVMANKVTFRLLKRRSCPGCPACDFLMADVQERGEPVIFPGKPKHKGLYRLIITNESVDWESGYIDDFDLALVEVP
jgi:hypothetical protein